MVHTTHPLVFDLVVVVVSLTLQKPITDDLLVKVEQGMAVVEGGLEMG